MWWVVRLRVGALRFTASQATACHLVLNNGNTAAAKALVETAAGRVGAKRDRNTGAACGAEYRKRASVSVLAAGPLARGPAAVFVSRAYNFAIELSVRAGARRPETTRDSLTMRRMASNVLANEILDVKTEILKLLKRLLDRAHLVQLDDVELTAAREAVLEHGLAVAIAGRMWNGSFLAGGGLADLQL